MPVTRVLYWLVNSDENLNFSATRSLELKQVFRIEPTNPVFKAHHEQLVKNIMVIEISIAESIGIAV